MKILKNSKVRAKVLDRFLRIEYRDVGVVGLKDFRGWELRPSAEGSVPSTILQSFGGMAGKSIARESPELLTLRIPRNFVLKVTESC